MDIHFDKKNELTEKLWGRVNVESGAALFLFSPESRVQQILHNIKYKKRRDIAIVLGEYLGKKLKESPHFGGLKCIIPVPLHSKKRRQRGYNQSEAFAIGLSKSLLIPVNTDVLIRHKYTETQTKKSRSQRLENVLDAFTILDKKSFKNQKILLVDDVMTTGATLEACALQLQKIEGIKISIACMAMAQY